MKMTSRLPEVVERLGMKVDYLRPSAGVLGMTDYKRQVITQSAKDWTALFHELAHSPHHTFEPKMDHDVAVKEDRVRTEDILSSLRRGVGNAEPKIRYTE